MGKVPQGKGLLVIGWIGVDFDGTLAKFSPSWPAGGEPVQSMVERVKEWHANGQEVRLLTARAGEIEIHRPILEAWMQKHLGFVLAITNRKDYNMIALYDDLAIAVKRDCGIILGGVEPDWKADCA